jgi:hypothetical protein
MKSILEAFPINEEEYFILNEKFGDLCEFAAWQLVKKNSRNNHTDEQADVAQELKMSLIYAGSYYKRQVYIENCLQLCYEYVNDPFLNKILDELQNLWDNKKRHGANRQKFGLYQEMLLDRLVARLIPKSKRPFKQAKLRMDSKFTTYCKAITWNKQKSLGKKITREKSIRAGQVSINEYDYLVSEY